MKVATEIEKVQAEVRQDQVQLDLSDESAYEVGDNDKSKIDKDYIQMNIADNSSKQNLTKLPTLAPLCDRYGVSNYADAAIASAMLVDYAITTKVDRSQVIESQKLGDERRRCREERREAELANLKERTSLYFDGKKTMTRVLVKNNKTGKWNPTIKVDDHYGVLTEPGNDYLTHVTPKTGHGKVVARAIYDFLVEHELTNQLLYVAGCDGCRINTGPNRGVIHQLEMLLARPQHYSICQLHGNELPFRAIFYYYDGKPSGPENWRGMIGQQIKEPVSDLPVIDFQPITFSDYPVVSEEEVNYYCLIYKRLF